MGLELSEALPVSPRDRGDAEDLRRRPGRRAGLSVGRGRARRLRRSALLRARDALLPGLASPLRARHRDQAARADQEDRRADRRRRVAAPLLGLGGSHRRRPARRVHREDLQGWRDLAAQSALQHALPPRLPARPAGARDREGDLPVPGVVGAAPHARPAGRDSPEGAAVPGLHPQRRAAAQRLAHVGQRLHGDLPLVVRPDLLVSPRERRPPVLAVAAEVRRQQHPGRRPQLHVPPVPLQGQPRRGVLRHARARLHLRERAAVGAPRRGGAEGQGRRHGGAAARDPHGGARRHQGRRPARPPVPPRAAPHRGLVRDPRVRQPQERRRRDPGHAAQQLPRLVLPPRPRQLSGRAGPLRRAPSST
jgi:hypothetical protein